jgi:hypothetical protein
MKSVLQNSIRYFNSHVLQHVGNKKPNRIRALAQILEKIGLHGSDTHGKSPEFLLRLIVHDLKDRGYDYLF